MYKKNKGEYKAVGSEKLTPDQKIIRIMEIANYNRKHDNKPDNGVSTIEYRIKAPDGKLYAILREHSSYIIKCGLNEASLDYINGMLNSKKYTFGQYSEALKKLNLMVKPLNERYNNGNGISLFEQQDDTKYVLKQDKTEEEPAYDETSVAEPTGDEMPPQEDTEGMDTPMDMEVQPEMGIVPFKIVQKLTGRLAQKLREMNVDMETNDIKYVLNSIISAVDLTKLSDSDKDEVIGKFESEDFGYGQDDIKQSMDSEVEETEPAMQAESKIIKTLTKGQILNENKIQGIINSFPKKQREIIKLMVEAEAKLISKKKNGNVLVESDSVTYEITKNGEIL